MKKRLLVGVSGASGAPIAVEVLRLLREYEAVESHLIVTDAAKMTLKQETGLSMEEVFRLADFVYENDNIGARPASGSFRMEGMVVVPCSMKTAAGIVSGYSDNLLLRAADVMLKERRKLVLVARESPFSTIHLRNLYEISRMGGIIMPPMLTYYHKPQTLQDCTTDMARRILRHFFDMDGGTGHFYEWEGIEQWVTE